ncbi:MAG: diaminopimelate decarboxylase [Pseudoalteromonas tetraodonis]|jgi:diaminopimelate decarboxylase
MPQTFFPYRDGELHAEDAPLSQLAEQFGTPLYVYSRAAFETNFNALDQAFSSVPHLVCYAMKANSNLAVLNILAKQGAGFDIVSGGELERVMAAGGDPAKIVFSGLIKTEADIRRALELGIKCFNLESAPELERINKVATEMGLKAPVSLRVNPDVDAQTHPYISTGLKENKFGIDINEAPRVYQRAASLPGINVVGVDCHIGSQLTETKPFEAALDRVLALIDLLTSIGINLHHIDIGGGVGIIYKDEQPPSAQEYADAVLAKLAGRSLEVLMEPGRSIAGNAGVMLTRVDFLKSNDEKNFAVVDGAMTDLLRPALYSAWQRILPVVPREGEAKTYDIVGTVCESSDFLGKDRDLVLKENDLLSVMSSGAYGFVMASNYNTRPRCAEVMVDGNVATLVRPRENVNDLFLNETLLSN